MGAGGGSSELQELREMVAGIIQEMEARICELEKLLPVGDRPGGGVVFGEEPISKPRKASKKKAVRGKKKSST